MPPDLNPTARALLALESIQAKPGITGDELAGRLGVSDRAARRYVGILRDAGMPVESVTGPYGGYRIGRGARVPPLMFSTNEALGLVMAVLQGWHGSVDSDHPAATALAKIVRVLPSTAAGPADAMRRVLAQNPGDAAASPDPGLTAALAQACEVGRQVRIRYGRSEGRSWEMVIDPWAVVVRHGRWYVLCWSRTADARRVLRLDRVLRCEPTGETYEPPAGLDPVREVEEHLADGWTYETEVRIDAPAEVVAHWVPRTLGRVEPIDAGSCLLRGSTNELDWYAGALAAIPLPFTVLGSKELQAEVRRLADRLSAAVAPARPATSASDSTA
ncbi:MAG TPA: WYL domain-containing protein [Mycobacteriales bacterium]|jgi:predicted DNA-binding transcriptional regulator YafY|nr:WYL domain-containing protein [Mycobacteriales bacterium]